MTWVSGFAVYAIIWWTVIFAVLPFGVQSIGAEDVSKGHAAGAPHRPRMLLKLAVTSIVAAVIWLLVYLLFESGVVRLLDNVANE